MNYYLKVNLDLLAKAISEMAYEEIVSPKWDNGRYVVKLKSGVSYHFEGTMGIWDYISINPQTIKRIPEIENLRAAQFFIDSQNEHGMDDIILANFIEELNNTIYSDLVIEANKIPSHKAIHLSDESLQAILNGHPKIILNKGRIGWGQEELRKYSPESSEGFQLVWLAIRKELCKSSFSKNYNMEALLLDSMDSKEYARFNETLKKESVNKEEFYFIPSHPWQYNRFVALQFVEEIQTKKIVYLGYFGDTYRPQISLRTLSNQSRQGRLDIKLPLTILNTSAIRGLTTRYIKAGPVFSDYVQNICDQDAILKNTNILKEVAGIGYISNHFEKIEKAPYRYHEFLGVTWRENPSSKNAQDEKSVMTGALFYVDKEGHSLAGEFIKNSSLNTEEWLSHYFKNVVIPLYHLQLKYGVALVSHGQNTVLKLTNFIPTGLYLKDFGGDLRLVQEKLELHAHIPESTALTKLPAHYLIHDLLTGHFVTVLRFVSAIMRDHDNLNELDFYRVLAIEVEKYQKDHPVENKALDLLNEKIDRVLVNAVRFKIGYSDSSERPVPILGTNITNPLYLGLKSQKEGQRL